MEPQPLALQPFLDKGLRATGQPIPVTMGTKNPKARIVKVSSLHHRVESDTCNVTTRWVSAVESDESPWQCRTYKVSRAWKALETGWLEKDNVSYLAVENLSQEIVYLGVSISSDQFLIVKPYAVVRPGRTIDLEPYLVTDVYLMSPEDCKVKVTVFPK